MLDQRTVVAALKAAAEPTRLRLLALLSGGEHTVTDLTRILGQSQPRISRHLKLLGEAGLIERVRDGSWAYFRCVDAGAHGTLLHGVLAALHPMDPVLLRDRQRAEAVKREREAAAQDYFRGHAPEWDRIRALHVTESEVESAMAAVLGPGPFGLLLDLGTGTGRMLELFADRYGRGLGLDINHTMLAYARGKLERAGLGKAQVRHGDLYHLPLADAAADAVVMHQVLHFLSEPAHAIREAARVLAPGGRLLIVDFAPHELEFLRDAFAHERLGFERAQVEQWLREAGLDPAATHELVPGAAAGADKLTVTLWLAENQRGAAPAQRPDRQKVEA